MGNPLILGTSCRVLIRNLDGIDYLMKVQVANPRAYDRFYQSLISDVKVFNVTALLSMEELKYTTALPL